MVSRRVVVGGMAALSAGSFRSAKAEEPIRIGVPLELSGRFVAFGSAGKRGAEMALDAFHGEVHGRKVELLIKDVQSDAQATVSAVNEFVGQDKVRYTFGPISSAMVAASIPPWREGKPVWIVHGSTGTLTEEQVGAEPHFFHTFPYAYHYQSSMSAALRHYLGAGQKATIIYADDAYGRGSLAFARKYFSDAGFKIIDELLLRSGANDFSPLLARIRAGKPEVVVNLVQTTDLANLAKQISISGVPAPYLTDGIDALFDAWQKAVGTAQQGWIGVTGYAAGIKRPASKRRPDIFPSATEWARKYQDRYKMDADYLDAGAYCAMALLLLALDEVGDDPEKVVDALGRIDIETPLGRAHFTATPSGTMHQAFQDLLVVQRQGNKNVVIYPEDVAEGRLIARKAS